MPPQAVDLTGRVFTRLTVVGRVPAKYTRECAASSAYWACRCTCGEFISADARSLTSGMTQSCGCLRREMVSAAHTTHGAARHGHKSPEYRSYTNARTRCTNPKCKDFKHYGGRGIEFRFTSFEQFFAEVGQRPAGMTLDRIRVDGHYEPGNVRWADAREQQWNKQAGARRGPHPERIGPRLKNGSYFSPWEYRVNEDGV